MRTCIFVIVIALFVLPAVADENLTPAPADVLISAASQKAKASDKNVLIMFHASWCRYCARLTRYLADDEVQSVISENYEVVQLDVLERGAKKQQENPGGDALLAKFGATGTLPFIAIISPDGELLTNSNAPATNHNQGGNIGFPSSPDEIKHFLSMIKASAKQADQDDLLILQQRLSQK